MASVRSSDQIQSKRIYSPLHICIAFIEEYKDHRQKNQSIWQTSIAYVLSLFGYEYSKLSEKRRDECDDLIKKLKAAQTFEEKSKLIDTFSSLAKKAQKPKAFYEKIPFWAQWVKDLFVKDNSLWAKTLHAVRTCWVAHLRTAHKKEFNDEIKTLREQYHKYKVLIDGYLKNKLKIIKEDEDEKFRLFNCLLDRQDDATLRKARQHSSFPELVPNREKNIKSPKKVDDYPDYPPGYDPKYCSIFYANTLEAEPARLLQFTRFMRAQLPKYVVVGTEMDIMSEGYFESIIGADELFEEFEDSEEAVNLQELEQEEQEQNDEDVEESQNETSELPEAIEANNETDDKEIVTVPSNAQVVPISIFNQSKAVDTETKPQVDLKEGEEDQFVNAIRHT